MPKRNLGLASLLAAMALLVMAGGSCGNGMVAEAGSPRPGSSGRGGLAGPTVDLVLPPTARLGEAVPITVRLRNTSSQPVNLELPGRPVAFDVVVTGTDGTDVWRRLHNRVTGSALLMLRLGPGESRDFATEWPQVDNQGRPVPAGSYNVQGMLPVGSTRLVTASRELLLVP